MTAHDGSGTYGGPADRLIVVDTVGPSRREVTGFTTILATRQLASGVVLVVGRRAGDAAGYVLYQVAAEGTTTVVRALPAIYDQYGSVDISPDGTAIAMITVAPYGLSVFTVASGAGALLESGGFAPRFSAQGDRVAYLRYPVGFPPDNVNGVAVVIGSNGSGRVPLGNALFTIGLAWSPDGAYLIGRNENAPGFGGSLRVMRVSDGTSVLVNFRSPMGYREDYLQPDWR